MLCSFFDWYIYRCKTNTGIWNKARLQNIAVSNMELVCSHLHVVSSGMFCLVQRQSMRRAAPQAFFFACKKQKKKMLVYIFLYAIILLWNACSFCIIRLIHGVARRNSILTKKHFSKLSSLLPFKWLFKNSDESEKTRPCLKLACWKRRYLRNKKQNFRSQIATGSLVLKTYFLLVGKYMTNKPLAASQTRNKANSRASLRGCKIA